ncbi:hypothetical protein [Polyangium spumosum]|nr:hypothetical protein [Polyangium spumosum]
MRWRGLGAAFAAAAAVASCNAVLGIDEGEPRATGSAFCEGKAEGTALPEQTAGDCTEVVCDGDGDVKVVIVESDVEDDGNPCTEDRCVGSVPSHAPLPSAPCYGGSTGTLGIGACKSGIQQCDAQGNPVGACVGEVLPDDEKCATVGVDDDCDGLVEEEGADCKCGDGIVSAGNGEQCDDGGTSDADACSAVCKEQRVLEVSAGGLGTCARLSGGRIKCWGLNAYGSLGLGHSMNIGDEPNEMGSALPPVDLDGVATRIEVNGHACALLEGGALKCWGTNEFGQLGLGDTAHRGNLPNQMGMFLPAVDLGQGLTAKAVAVGVYHTCAILSNDMVKCWGLNDSGQLGLGDTERRGDDPGEMGDALPELQLGGKVKAITAGATHTCAILFNDKVKCWGGNFYGQLGLGDTNDRGNTPSTLGAALDYVDLGTDKPVKSISAGGYTHTCAILDEGMVKCWGGNEFGQLGLEDTEHRGDAPNEMGTNLPAVKLGNGTWAVAITARNNGTCALGPGGGVRCWGKNDYGSLGLGDLNDRGDAPGEMGDALPVVALGADDKGALFTTAAITANDLHACALLSIGAVKCWGLGNRLGLGDFESRGDGPGEMGDALPTVKLFSSNW